MVEISPTFPERVIDTVCYTAQKYNGWAVRKAVRHQTRRRESSERIASAIEIPCPAVMVLKPPATFSKVNQKSQMVKISAAFLERSIDNLCYATYMYKVELRRRGLG